MDLVDAAYRDITTIVFEDEGNEKFWKKNLFWWGSLDLLAHQDHEGKAQG